jgi:hypothetical protein
MKVSFDCQLVTLNNSSLKSCVMANKRDRQQTHDTQGEAQNVNIDQGSSGKPGGNDKDAEHGRNKATEGIRQRRDDSVGSNNKNRDRMNDITGVE